jgi:ABC-2 type transport system ATP-binding protein
LEEPVLSIQHLSKNYGKIRAVDDLSLDVHKGNVYGILGPNGSGKTTTLGIILSVINRSGGEFSWFGKTPSKETRKHIGAILEVPIFYPYLSGEKNLKIIADIKSCSYDGIADVLKTVDLAERKKSKFKTYSLGMKQRLAIAAALIGDPEVLIFDEPTNGLDPQGIAEIRELILRIAALGKTIILASHLLDEVQKTCSHVVILDKGKNLFAGKVSELTVAPMHVEVGAENMEDLEKHLNENENVIGIEKENMILVVKLKEGYKGTALNEFLFSKGVLLTHLSARKKSLEKYFLELLAEK